VRCAVPLLLGSSPPFSASSPVHRLQGDGGGGGEGGGGADYCHWSSEARDVERASLFTAAAAGKLLLPGAGDRR